MKIAKIKDTHRDMIEISLVNPPAAFISTSDVPKHDWESFVITNQMIRRFPPGEFGKVFMASYAMENDTENVAVKTIKGDYTFLTLNGVFHIACIKFL